MAKTGKSQFAILGMLALLKESSGYDLKKHMEASTEYFWKETFSSIYPVLEDLEKQNLIVKIDKPTKNDRKRNIYALTSEGRETLKDWLMQPPEKLQLRNELLLKLFFGNLVPIKVNIDHLEKYKEELQSKLSIFTEIEKDMAEAKSLELLYNSIALDHGIRQVSSSLEWCDSAIKRLKASEKLKLKKK